MNYTVFPFTALVGQEGLKMGLLLNAINPAIGGMLIRGEKGTAKSTAVRGLANVLPEIEVISGCRFSCDPARPDDFCQECATAESLATISRRVRLVNLPLGVTEDRVLGGIDFSRTIKSGEAILQPGLLAEAHRSILYVDEVNLLDDHIVDLILDAAASGRNVIEREGISHNHPAKLILIGTMNPEEGDLRPQLLDRFGLCVEVKASEELDLRIELLIRREEFDQDPESFTIRYKDESQRLRDRIVQAQKRLTQIRFPAHIRMFISELCTSGNVAGHRADLVMEQAARALAAFDGVDQVTNQHISRVAPMVLIHRTRDAAPPPPENQQPEQQENEESLETDSREETQNEPPPQTETEESKEQQQKDESQDVTSKQEEEKSNGGQQTTAGEDLVFDIGETFRVKKIAAAKDRLARRGSGRRTRSRISQKQGRYIKATLGPGTGGDIAIDATIRAAAPFQKDRKEKNRNGALAVYLQPSDIRLKVREKKIGNLLLFVVDGSGSMGARGRMTASKSAIMSLLLDAYQKRDKVAMISFRRDKAWLNLPVTGSVELAGKLLAEMPVGGRTPLSAGLSKSVELVRNYLIREPEGKPIVIILTDGKANVSLGEDKPVAEMVRLANGMSQESRVKYIVVDTEEESRVTFGLAKRLASALGADYFKTTDLKAQALVNIVREQQ